MQHLVQYDSPVHYEQPVYTDPAFPIVFHRDMMDDTRHTIYTNWHAGIELLYCIQGSGELLYGSEIAPFGVGDLVVVTSNVIHSLRLTTEPCVYYCMIVEPSFLAAHSFPHGEVRFSPVVRDEQVLAVFRRIIDCFLEKDAYYKPLVASQTLMLFVHLLRQHTVPEDAGQTVGERRSQRIIMQAIAYIREHLHEPIHLERLSRHVGMSKYYFCRQFLTYTGTSVTYHINALKCDFARKLLRENGFNVSEAAHYLGFQNLSYFSKLYKKHIGILPSQELLTKAAMDKRGEVYGLLRAMNDSL